MIENLDELEKREVMNLLDKAQIPKSWLGYKCITTAVPLVMDSNYCGQKIFLKDLYKEVAKKHKTTASKVESAIRYVHENTRIKKILGKEKISNGRLLFLIAEYIAVRLRL